MKAQPGLDGGEVLLAATALLPAAAILARALVGGRSRRTTTPPARRAAWGAGLVAASVAADSALEHYRGSYRKRPMAIAPPTALATVAAALATALSRGGGRMPAAVHAIATVTGLVGTGFHAKNILDRPGGLSFNNLFYRAPFGAPGALVLAGLFGLSSLAADRAAGSRTETAKVGRGLGAVTSAGYFGLAAEIGLLHFRGAFHNPLMYAPVLGVPVTGAMLARASLSPTPGHIATARGWLGLTTALGVAGTALHAYGVSRNMGGFANLSQNVFAGPPVAAPPSLIGMALAGDAGLRMIEEAARR